MIIISLFGGYLCLQVRQLNLDLLRLGELKIHVQSADESFGGHSEYIGLALHQFDPVMHRTNGNNEHTDLVLSQLNWLNLWVVFTSLRFCQKHNTKLLVAELFKTCLMLKCYLIGKFVFLQGLSRPRCFKLALQGICCELLLYFLLFSFGII